MRALFFAIALLAGSLVFAGCASDSPTVDPTDGGTDAGDTDVIDAGDTDAGRELAVVIDAPRVLRRTPAGVGATGQYAYATSIPGASYAWSLTAAADRTPARGGSLLVFDVLAGEEVRLEVTVTAGGATGRASVDIPVVPLEGPLRSGTSPVSAGPHLVFVPSLLRGQRVALQTEPAAPMELLDFQGRRVVSRDGRIDVRVPVRGSYLLWLDATVPTTLTADGVRPQTGEDGAPEPGTTPTPPTALPARVDSTLWAPTGFVTAESMVRSGDLVVTAVYDYAIARTRVTAHRLDGSIAYQWTSDDDVYARSLFADGEGGVYATGSSGVAGAADSSFALHLGPTGALLFYRVFSMPGDEFAYGVSADASGRVYMSGMSTSGASGAELDGFVRVLSASGDELALRTFGGAGPDRVFASCGRASGAVLFGDTRSNYGALSPSLGPGGSTDLFLVEVSSDGTVGTPRRFGGSQPDLAFACDVDTDGNLYLHGMTRSTLGAAGGAPPAGPQAFVVRAAATLEPTWSVQLGPAEGQSAEAVDVDGDGVTMLFYTNGSFPGGVNTSLGTRASDDAVLARLGLDGELRWVRQFYDTTERVFARGLAVVGDDIFMIQDHVYVVGGGAFSSVTVDRLATR